MDPTLRLGMTPAAFARRVGLSADLLRSYEVRGLFRAAIVDEATRRRRYSTDQLRHGRLLAALAMTGTPVTEAAALVASGDRARLLQRLERSRQLVQQGLDALPPAGGASASTFLLDPAAALAVDLDPARDLLDQLREARAAVAGATGCAVRELPGWGPDAGLPGGPRVVLEHGGGGFVPAEIRLGAPLLLDELPAGVRGGAEHSGAWAVAGSVPAEDWEELLRTDHPVHVALQQLADDHGAWAHDHRLAWDAELARVSVVARLH